MGEQDTEDWSARLAAAGGGGGGSGSGSGGGGGGGGKVELTSSRRRRVRRVVWFGLMALLEGFVVVINNPFSDERTSWQMVSFFICSGGLVLFVGLGLRTLYELRTGKPRLTIDRQGVRLGRRQLGWTEIASIRWRPAGMIGIPSVMLAGDRWSRHIYVTSDHVEDLEGFSDWLEGMRSAQSAANGG